MTKRLIIVLAVALALGLTFSAYAEVQNVKVSGDLSISAIGRNNLDLVETDYTYQKNRATREPNFVANDTQSNFMSIARVRIDADLTDNVSTTVRLLNERDWDGEETTTADGEEAGNINLDLAFVSMKEFLYSPLSVTLGRQLLRYGNGLIIGDPDTNGVSGVSTLASSDLSARKSFDAVKAVLDYDPLVVDLVYAKIDEATVTGWSANDDVDLLGISGNYKVDNNTSVDAYVFSKRKGSNATAFTAGQRTTTAALNVLPNKPDIVHTAGAHIVNTSVKNLNAQLEGAFQFGTYNPGFDINSADAARDGQRRAWALQTILNYNLADIVPEMLAKYKPSVMGTYTFLSGEKNTRTTGTYHGWDSMFEDQTLGHLINAVMGFSNSQILSVTTKFTPMEDVLVNLDYVTLWLNKRYPYNSQQLNGVRSGIETANLSGLAGANTYVMNNEKHLGQEIDATVTYNYTEDVQFSLLGGLFIPGDAFGGENDAKAAEVIGSMKVTF